MHVTMDQAQAERGRLKQLIGSLAPRFAEADARSAELAATVADRPIVEFLGAGPDYAVAEYGAAKLLEAAGHHAYARDLEEWAHLNYFDARPEDISTVIAIAPESRAQGRAVELLAYLHRLGRRIFVVGGGPAADAARRLGHAVLPVDGPEELWSPLLLSAPMALIAAQMATAGGAEYGRGSQGRWADSADASTVQKSEIWKPAP
jgi:glucosamine--fructose-6-phosphate aminotransferase (isomerizing)